MRKYLDAGKHLIKLKQNAKSPLSRGWRNEKNDLANLELYLGNVGWRLGPSDLIVDVDPRNGGLDSLAKLERDLDIKIRITVATPSGGFHGYYRKDGRDIKKSLKAYPGIDFITYGGYVVIPKSKIKGIPYKGEFSQEDAPEALLDLIGKKAVVTKLLVRETEIKQCLQLIPPDVPYPKWVNVGMGLKSWDVERGYELWYDWSRKGKKFKAREMKAKWDTFSADGGTTISSVIHYAREITKENEAHWADNWVFVSNLNKYLDMKTGTPHGQAAFNLLTQHHVLLDHRGALTPPHIYVRQRSLIRVVDRIEYVPYSNEQIVQLDDSVVYNSFKSSSVPETALEFTKKGEKAIKMVLEHIAYLYKNDPESGKILLEWIAHIVQFPGKKIPWAPLIQGPEGIGKSYIGDLLKSLMGTRNIGVVSPNQTTSTFNSWAQDVVVNLLEEMKIAGKNRHDYMNSIKSLITDTHVQINAKNVQQYKVLNVTNYIAFTNFLDAIPLGRGDRRWFAHSCPYESIEDFEKEVGRSSSDYFSELFRLTTEHPGELRKFFLEYKISKKFKAMNRAPHTEFKGAIIRTEESKVEGLEELRDLIEKGSVYYNSEVVLTNYLFSHFEYAMGEKINTSRCRYMLQQLGYMRQERRVQVDGKRCTVWARNNMPKDKLRRCLRLMGKKK